MNTAVGRYAQVQVSKRGRDLSAEQLRRRWSETGALDHYRHAHAFDYLASFTVPVQVTILG